MTSRSNKAPQKTKVGRGSSSARGLDAAEHVEIDYGRLQSISKLVQLQDVELMSLAFASQADPREMRREEAGRPEYALNIVDARWHRRDSHFELVLGYEVVGALRSDANHEIRPLFRLLATWVVSYSLPDDFERPENHEEVAADFVIANGQVNVFPFLRQLVVDSTAKAGWPPLFLPVFRIPKTRRRGLVRNAPAWE